MVAGNAHERDRLDFVVRRAIENGCAEPVPLDAADLRARVPELAEGMCAGLLIPGEHVIDPWSAPLAYARDAIAHGAEFRRETTVLGGELTRSQWRLATANGTIEAGLVVNCAGLYGDIVEGIVRPSPFRIRPRRGVFDKSAAPLLQTILLPNPDTKDEGDRDLPDHLRQSPRGSDGRGAGGPTDGPNYLGDASPAPGACGFGAAGTVRARGRRKLRRAATGDRQPGLPD
jgi:glycine/D-amino acid oxidase-like deaminating enzyme